MRRTGFCLAAALLALAWRSCEALAAEAPPAIGVSWPDLADDRFAPDEAAIRETLAKAGAKLLSADARGSAERQSEDIARLVADGAKAVIVAPADPVAIVPAVRNATAAGASVVAYGRPIAGAESLYVGFD